MSEAAWAWVCRLCGMVAGAAGISVAVALVSAWLQGGDLLFREHGVLEVVSLGFWMLSGLLGFALATRSTGPASRLMAAWTGWMSVLAALRELDLHGWLNPQHLGALGVRYRLDWWLNGDVSIWLRLGWAAAFLTVSVFALYPPVKLRRVLWRLVREGDAFTGLLVLAMGFLALGFVIDDLLRPVRFVSAETKRLIEETSETIGAGLFCVGVGLLWRKPIRSRLDQLGLEPAVSGTQPVR